jgi:tuftelin-interacting protein 11
MDEYQHHEKLSADGTFEEGQWINGEFFYKKRKAARQQTEDDRLYGVWQGSSSDEDEDGFRKRRKRRGNDSAALHKEVAFVSSGTVTGTTETEDKFVVRDKVGALSTGNMLFT